MGSYETTIDTLAGELAGIEAAFRGLAGPEWTAILDDLLARRTLGRRPDDLYDDLAWVLAASGRAEHADNRLPLIG